MRLQGVLGELIGGGGAVRGWLGGSGAEKGDAVGAWCTPALK